MSLKEYNNKRNFNNTKEPIGKITRTNCKRFVIQYHKARTTHYDFRLEYNGALMSFAVPKGIPSKKNIKRLAVKVEDHPIDYITFEGDIPKGNYGAGNVKIYDKGFYIPIMPFRSGIKNGIIKFELKGEKIKGCYALIKTNEKNWIIIKIDDEHKNTKQSKINFSDYNVELATLTNNLPDDNGWLYEIKYDGYRMLSYVNDNEVIIKSRNNVDYSNKIKDISNSLIKLNHNSFIVDGEIVSFDKYGRSNFKLLQDNLKTGKNIFYVIFDLLMFNGKDLRNLPLRKRKQKLKLILKNKNNNLVYSSHIYDGLESLNYAKKHNLEGIIAKKIASKYIGKRTDDWIKIKSYARQEFIIVGYTITDKNKDISSLLLGYYLRNNLIYAGKVGTGFTIQKRKELKALFSKYETKKVYFQINTKDKNIKWLKLKFVCEVQYLELTKDKLLRHPSFIALRSDKKVKEVVLENESKY